MPPLPQASRKGISDKVATVLLAAVTTILRRWMRPYQVAWLEDQSRFKCGVMSRQIGKSEVIVLEAVLVALQPPKSPEQVVLLVSSSDAQARELLRKATRWTDLFDACLKKALGPPATIYAGKPTSEQIPLINGVRIIAIPANPRTAAGFSGHVFWDEAGRTPFDALMYEALMPITDEGPYLFRMTGTPWGDSGVFYDTCMGGGGAGPDGLPLPRCGWSRHRVTIVDALAQGLDRPGLSVEDLSYQFDPITLQQDYYCEFVSSVNQVFGRDLLKQCMELDIPAAPFLDSGIRRSLGIDIGRTHDKTVGVWMAEYPEDFYQVERVHPIHQMPFMEQEEFFASELRTGRIVKSRMDATGLGMPMGENLHRRFPSIMEPVTFSPKVKEELVNLVLALAESRHLKLKADNDLISDMSAIRRTYLPAGGIRYDAERTVKGHADAFWALGLATSCLSGAQPWRISFMEEDGTSGLLARPAEMAKFDGPPEDLSGDGIDLVRAVVRQARPGRELPTPDDLGFGDGDGSDEWEPRAL